MAHDRAQWRLALPSVKENFLTVRQLCGNGHADLIDALHGKRRFSRNLKG